jgi:hypothetical protein
MTPALIVALLITRGLRSRDREAHVLAVIVGLALLKPAAGVGAALGLWLARLSRRVRLGRSARADAAQEVSVLARLLLIGLSAGLSLHSALAHTHGELRDDLASDVDGVLKRSRVAGLAAALSGGSGPGAKLFSLMAGSVVSGASVAPVLVGFLHERAAEEKAARLARARRLPIRLTIPLTLLILPGWLLLFVGPPFLQGIADLVPAFSGL